MRKRFSWHLTPNEASFEQLWENCIFAFDANVFLDLYELSQGVCKDLWKILDHLVKEERLWMPHQVALEYLNNRGRVIRNVNRPYDHLRDALEAWSKQQREYRSLVDKLNAVHNTGITREEIKAWVAPEIQEIEKRLEEIEKLVLEPIAQSKERLPTKEASNDPILDKLLDLFDGRTGEGFSDQELVNIHKAGKERHRKKIPPGHTDADKEEEGKDPFGDYVIWLELLKYAEGANKPIIFVSNEKKPDWWEKEESKKDIFVPARSLRREFQSKVSKSFWMYRLDSFMSEASDRLRVNVEEDSLHQIELLEEEREKREEEAISQAFSKSSGYLAGVGSGSSEGVYLPALETLGGLSAAVAAAQIGSMPIWVRELAFINENTRYLQEIGKKIALEQKEVRRNLMLSYPSLVRTESPLAGSLGQGTNHSPETLEQTVEDSPTIQKPEPPTKTQVEAQAPIQGEEKSEE